MDAAMGVQFIIYGEGKKTQAVGEVLVVEEEGFRGPERWRRVSGWMRGWMPSAATGKTKRVDEGFETETETDTESLLSVRAGDDTSSIRSYGTMT